MLRIYSTPISNDNSVDNDQSDILDDLLPFIITWKVWSDIMEDYNRSTNLFDLFNLGDNTQCDTDQCYFAFNPP